MDLLDDLEETGNVQRYNFDTQIVNHEESYDSSSEGEDYHGDIEGQNKLSTNESDGVKGDIDQDDGVRNMLERIKQRLSGPERLPQLSAEDADIRSQQTTKPQSPVQEEQGLFVDEEESDRDHEGENNLPLQGEQREEQLAQLIEKKRRERMENGSQKGSLEEELQAAASQEDYEDFLEVGNKTVTSQISKKDLREAEEFLNVQRREVDIRPEFQPKIIISKNTLLSAFDDSTDESDAKENNDEMPRPASSPVTSPVDTSNKLEKDGLDTAHLLPHHSPSNISGSGLSVVQSKNPIEMYAQNLKNQLLSSPNSGKGEKLISLDSDSDSSSNSDARENAFSMGYTTAYGNKPDSIPDLSKADKLAIKQKFSKKRATTKSSVIDKLPSSLRQAILNYEVSTQKSFLRTLRSANTLQLKNSTVSGPDTELLQEFEKEEEIMGSLLEKEIERVRNIRRKERLKEKAKLSLLDKNNTLDVPEKHDSDFEDDVPDSDASYNKNSDEDDVSGDESDYPAEFEESASESLSPQEKSKRSERKMRRVVLSDDDETDESKVAFNDRKSHPLIDNTNDRSRSDDSYMFGAKNSNIIDDNAGHDGITVDNTIAYVSFNENSQNPTQPIYRKDSINPSQNKRSNNLEQDPGFQSAVSLPVDDTYNSQQSNAEANTSTYNVELPTFDSIDGEHPEPISHNSNYSIPTQVDNSSQKYEKTQIDINTSTQVDAEKEEKTFKHMPHDTQKVTFENVASLPLGESILYTEADDKPQNTSVANNDAESTREHSYNENDEFTESEEQYRAYKERLKAIEKKRRRKRQQLERLGMKGLVEGEAEESEDEWHGLGGADGEYSEEENSEDEKMIDHRLNIDLNDEEVRRKFMEQYQINDQKELEKLLDDIKNHRLTKMAAGGGLDIELSDEEDELLVAYRRQKLEEQKQRLISNRKLQTLMKNEKSKAFFESIQDSTSVIKIDEDDHNINGNESDNNDSIMTQSKSGFEALSRVDRSESENPFVHTDEDKDSVQKNSKKSIRIEQPFVQKQLEFLNYSTTDRYDMEQKLSEFQHGLNSDDEAEDMNSLKMRSLRNLKTTSEQETARNFTYNVDTLQESDADDDEFLPSLKKRSIMIPFKTSNGKSDGVSNPNYFSGVSVSKQYRAASGSTASITYMSRTRKGAVKSLKEKKLEKTLMQAKSNRSSLFGNDNFEN
ncbi:Piso0_005620 [Millerozyma farinosa CBS 7064]|uniref:Piso0_005620 protein n=1 Tax=Pichia sorbitophila (strain ATCC MYA-4447 / BCRC 22081 / CBS 7064 / NBRC 10061 / NRRL Y-12695) TaxID=559304 RepID=G8XZH4_PICSO|nr:Piso0_005620 [Millerozyma farinosa CBS 7064]